MNYYLSVIPFICAVEAGVIDLEGLQLKLLKPSGRADQYCNSIASCRELIPETFQKWIEFYKGHCTPIDAAQLDYLLYYMWDAHKASLESAYEIFEDLLSGYPLAEQKVGRGWAHFVEYIAFLRLITNCTYTYFFEELSLPKRLLRDGDHPPFIRDLTVYENQSLAIINVLLFVDSYTGNCGVTTTRKKVHFSGNLIRDKGISKMSKKY
uniref:UPF0762 protein C6orf58-like n=1 Tax=Saccoglossus kowalevskii TaxID=10224 RepID=A0ABM0M6K3_SACKO|nr:PREDICTED: UPF0762 protein C6orf58-like [Saccoglossus kowalevskii]